MNAIEHKKLLHTVLLLLLETYNGFNIAFYICILDYVS